MALDLAAIFLAHRFLVLFDVFLIKTCIVYIYYFTLVLVSGHFWHRVSQLSSQLFAVHHTLCIIIRSRSYFTDELFPEYE